MALIKQADAGLIARDAIVLDLGDLARQGEALRSRSRAEADAIVAQAKAERERLIAGAKEEGFAQGLARGEEEGRKRGEEAGREAAMAEAKDRIDRLVSAWEGALAAFEGERDRMLLEARQDVLRLALAVAEKVTKRVVRVDPGVVEEQIAAVLGLITRPTRLVVSVHPEDLARAREVMPGMCERLAKGSHVEVVADAALERGSCVARTAGRGEIDASIATQLERIAAALLPEPPAGEGGGP